MEKQLIYDQVCHNLALTSQIWSDVTDKHVTMTQIQYYSYYIVFIHFIMFLIFKPFNITIKGFFAQKIFLQKTIKRN